MRHFDSKNQLKADNKELALHVKRFSELTTEELYKLLKMRQDVFVLEQQCLYADIDGMDKAAIHIWLEDESGPVAYLRLLDRGVESEYVSIGRVLTRIRGIGLGHQILQKGIQIAVEEYQADVIYLEAQAYIKEMYESHGFRPVSEEFDLDGIPHVKMIKTL